MRVETHPKFDRLFRKRIATNRKLTQLFKNRLAMFRNNPTHPLLHDHQLTGKKQGLRSFSITGDIRVVYRKISSNIVILLDIGSHAQVY